MRFLLPLIGIGWFVTATAGSITTSRIIAVSDSILTAKVGEHLMPYFEISDTGTHYKYWVTDKKINTEQFLSKKRITKNVAEIWVMYHFNYTKIDGIRSGIWIKLDGNLQLLEEPNLSAVPEFLIQDSPMNFISKNAAREMAIKAFSQKGDEITEPQLQYLKKNGKYVYTVANKIHAANKKVTEMEIVELDVYTGKLLSRYDSYNGLIEK